MPALCLCGVVPYGSTTKHSRDLKAGRGSYGRIQISKKTFEEALSIVEATNRGKLTVEEALRKWRFEHDKKKSNGKRKVSLGQILSKPSGDLHATALKGEKDGGHKQLPTKRKKFGFAQILFLVTKQGKKKKKQTVISRCHSG
ncbi:unnamed protein product [Ilex paraguariensis]|uniref:Uncharacterized protein n=1 Tax=Ilex paraguariensis TaxID=185542 RepID=A0ABC8R3U2_9AQUA